MIQENIAHLTNHLYNPQSSYGNIPYFAHAPHLGLRQNEHLGPLFLSSLRVQIHPYVHPDNKFTVWKVPFSGCLYLCSSFPPWQRIPLRVSACSPSSSSARAPTWARFLDWRRCFSLTKKVSWEFSIKVSSKEHLKAATYYNNFVMSFSVSAAVIGNRLHVPVAVSCVVMAFYILFLK